jgi:hypothetical protein
MFGAPIVGQFFDAELLRPLSTKAAVRTDRGKEDDIIGCRNE